MYIKIYFSFLLTVCKVHMWCAFTVMCVNNVVYTLYKLFVPVHCTCLNIASNIACSSSEEMEIVTSDGPSHLAKKKAFNILCFRILSLVQNYLILFCRVPLYHHCRISVLSHGGLYIRDI